MRTILKRLSYPILILILIFIFNWRTQEIALQKLYDLSNKNPILTSKITIDELLNSFETIKYLALDVDYSKKSQSNISPYKAMLSNKTFYLISGKDRYKRIVNQFRIKDFMPKDSFYKKSLLKKQTKLYWLIDKELLYKTLQLQKSLEEKGYSKNSFYIVNGHRHPTYNIKVGGASQSRHIVGQALDISVKDINGDGQRNSIDKEIILDILENEVIRDKGGIGRYPHSRTAIHYDVRGYKARWDKQ